MKRTVITVDGNGILSIPSNLENLWMSEGELVNMLHVTAPKLNSVIQVIYKDIKKACCLCRKSNKDKKLPRVFGKHCMDSLWLLPFASVSPLMGLCNFVMPSSRGCTEQKRKQSLSYNSTEGQMPLAEIGCIFDASIIHCRIDLPTY